MIVALHHTLYPALIFFPLKIIDTRIILICMIEFQILYVMLCCLGEGGPLKLHLRRKFVTCLTSSASSLSVLLETYPDESDLVISVIEYIYMLFLLLSRNILHLVYTCL